jgi:hypothetical protein
MDSIRPSFESLNAAAGEAEASLQSLESHRFWPCSEKQFSELNEKLKTLSTEIQNLKDLSCPFLEDKKKQLLSFRRYKGGK